MIFNYEIGKFLCNTLHFIDKEFFSVIASFYCVSKSQSYSLKEKHKTFEDSYKDKFYFAFRLLTPNSDKTMKAIAFLLLSAMTILMVNGSGFEDFRGNICMLLFLL